MKKITVLLVIMLFASTFIIIPNESVKAAFSGLGAGTVGDPYQITTLDQLNEIRNSTHADYILMNDIDATATSTWYGGEGWMPHSFSGVFNGDNHTISNLYISRSKNHQGFFGLLVLMQLFLMLELLIVILQMVSLILVV